MRHGRRSRNGCSCRAGTTAHYRRSHPRHAGWPLRRLRRRSDRRGQGRLGVRAAAGSDAAKGSPYRSAWNDARTWPWRHVRNRLANVGCPTPTSTIRCRWAYGVTMFRAVDARMPWAASQRSRVQRGEILAPRLWVGGPALDAPNGAPDHRRVTDAASARREVAALAGLGVDWVSVSGLVNLDTYRNIVRSARGCEASGQWRGGGDHRPRSDSKRHRCGRSDAAAREDARRLRKGVRICAGLSCGRSRPGDRLHLGDNPRSGRSCRCGSRTAPRGVPRPSARVVPGNVDA